MINKWEIYLCQLDPIKGSEQKGLRPVLIVSNDAVNHTLPVSTIIPFSSITAKDRIYPTEILLPKDSTGLEKNSVVMIHQIRTISHTRFVKKMSELVCSSYQDKIMNAIKDYFEY